jgi:uncharacterized protein (DUF927 family)
VGEITYLIANAVGKARMSAGGRLQRRSAWRTTFLSSGERTLSEHMRHGGRVVKAGQEVRLIDVPAEAGVGLGLFEDLHGIDSSATFAKQLEEAATEYYGVAIRAFLHELVIRDQENLSQQVRGFRQKFLEDHVAPGLSGYVLRICNRFSLVAAAGELATSFGVLPWASGEALKAASRCFSDWMNQREKGDDSEVKVALARVQEFLIESGESRFPDVQVLRNGNGQCDPTQWAGVRRLDAEKQVEWLVFRDNFQSEICMGLSSSIVSRILLERGHLRPDSQGKRTRPERIPGIVGLERVFCIRASVLDEEVNSHD